MTLSIIIVNYNVKELLEQCLLSVEAAMKNIHAEVFIVDNASTDGSIEHLKPRFPSFTFVQNTTNVGFARANNTALQHASGKFILFLNPDTVVPEHSFRRCVEFFDEHPDAGALGVKMLDGTGKFLKESKRGLPTPAAAFFKLTGIINIFPRSRITGAYYAGHLSMDKSSKVDVLSGAFMMVRKKVLDIVGGFDERFFMYAEDIDLSYRILQSGYNNYYLADVTITHFKGSSTKKDLKYVRQFYKAMSQYVRKHYGRGIYSLFLDAGIVLRGTLAAILQFVRRTGKNST